MKNTRFFFLDTDVLDCDDAAAIALMTRYAVRYGTGVIGITHCTSSEYGVGAIRSLLDWYGMPEIPVGTLADRDMLGTPGISKYTKTLALSVPEEKRTAGDAVRLLMNALGEREDGTVEMMSIGPMRNLRHFVEDDACRELIARKVKRLTLMAGDFSEGCGKPEWNVEMDIASARIVSKKWPTEMVYCGFEVGLPVWALKEPVELAETNPVRIAYRLHADGLGRASCDLCTVQAVMDFGCTFYRQSAFGTIEIDERGMTRWKADPDGRHAYLMLNEDPAVIAADFEKTLTEYDRLTGRL